MSRALEYTVHNHIGRQIAAFLVPLQAMCFACDESKLTRRVYTVMFRGTKKAVYFRGERLQ